jgi:DNA polymerase III subunit epsilon
MTLAICLSCGQEQEQERAFAIWTASLSGYRHVCLTCVQVAEDTGRKVCLHCHERFEISAFSVGPDRVGDLCETCLRALSDAGQKWCVSCAQVKPITVFSQRPGMSTLSSRCDPCLAAFAARTEKRCSECGQVKPLDAFPRNAASADVHRHACKACLGMEEQLPRSVSVAVPSRTGRGSSSGSRFPYPSVPYFSPEIDVYRPYDWRRWARVWLKASQDRILIDVETTGVSFKHALTEVAVIDLTGEVLFDTLINPEQPIPAEVVAKTGITDAMVAGQPTFADICDELMAILTTRGTLAYNIRFDVRMIAAEFYRLTGGEVWVPIEHGCMMRAFQAYRMTYGVRHPEHTGDSLSAACAAMSVVPSHAHRALGDCQSTLALLRAMADEEGLS